MQKSISGRIRRRMMGVLVCFCLFGFTVLVWRLFTIQIVKGEMYQSRAAQQQTRSTNLEAERGTIYDRNGTTLARSATVWNVCISPADVDFDNFAPVAAELGKILEVDPTFVMEQAAKRQTYYQRIARRVNVTLRDEVLEYVTENDVDGIFFEEDTKRYYTYGSLASTVLGFTNYDNHGAYGLESYYDKTLSGTPGVVVSAKNALGSDMPFKYSQKNEARDGDSLVLTIDEGIQHFLEKHLETAIVEHSIGNRASAIAMNVNTGEILGMATKNDFDPNDPYTITDPGALAQLEEFAEENETILRLSPEKYKTLYDELEQDLLYEQWRNKAISDPYEPGSTFKIITAATGLDNKVVSLGDTFYCSGQVTVSGQNYNCHDHNGHGQQSFTRALQNSCNPAFIAIGQRVGARLMFDYMDNFGFGELTGVDLPGEAEGILHSYKTLSRESMIELSSTSFGQTFKATPLQMITAVSAAVNGGNLMQPYIVKQVLDSEGNVVETTQPTVRRQVLSRETSMLMRDLVEAVVVDGSGRKAAIPGYRIGGKTGTSEKIDEHGNESNILSFVGFAPMEDPQYAILVMLDEPYLTNAYGSVIAAPVVGAIFQEMLPYVGLEATFTQEELLEREVEVPYLVGEKPHDAQSKLTALGLQTRIVGNGADVVRQIPQSGQTMPKGLTVTLYTDAESITGQVTVPDVVGMTAQEANRAIVTDAGLSISLKGVTGDGMAAVVVDQWPAAGSAAHVGDTVEVTLAERQEEPTQQTVLPDLDLSSLAPGAADG